MSTLAFFTWCENTGIGETIRESTWLFPVIEAFHLLALAVIGGSVLIVDLRLMGWGLKKTPLSRIARDAQPFLLGSLAVMIVSGVLLFTSEATKLYYHDAFWVKMTSLLLAIVFYFTVQRKVIFTEEKNLAPLWAKLVAIVSVVLWSGVGIGGRWIGFS